MEGLRRGYFTKDPSQLHDPSVCAPYINNTIASMDSPANAKANAAINSEGSSTVICLSLVVALLILLV